MRGKKADPAFISQFIQESVKSGMQTPPDIVAHAKDLIAKIDEEIKAVETKKITRSKLLDVIAAFEMPTRDKSDEAKLLSFFNLGNQVDCKFICDIINVKPLDVEKLKVLDQDKRFAIKQLIECGVLYKDAVSDQIKQDFRFDDYMKFVLHEGN